MMYYLFLYIVVENKKLEAYRRSWQVNRRVRHHSAMILSINSIRMYKRHRFPPEIIQYAVWLYHRFNLSQRDTEDLLAQSGLEESYEAIRLWCDKFGPRYCQRLRRKHQVYGDTFFIYEVFVKIQGQRHYLWMAVDQDGEVVEVFLQIRRDGEAAKRFFRRLLHKHNGEPKKIFTDRLTSYGVAHRELIPGTIHDTSQHANNEGWIGFR